MLVFRKIELKNNTGKLKNDVKLSGGVCKLILYSIDHNKVNPLSELPSTFNLSGCQGQDGLRRGGEVLQCYSAGQTLRHIASGGDQCRGGIGGCLQPRRFERQVRLDEPARVNSNLKTKKSLRLGNGSEAVI